MNIEFNKREWLWVKEILKPIFEWLTGNYNLFDNVLYNYAVMVSIGFLAFVVAWRIVGFLYAYDLIRGRTVGSIIHWSVRFIAFVIIFTVVSVIIWFIKLILLIPAWFWFVLLGAIVVTIIGFTYKHFSTERLAG